MPLPYIVGVEEGTTPPFAPHLSLAPRASGHLTSIRWFAATASTALEKGYFKSSQQSFITL